MPVLSRAFWPGFESLSGSKRGKWVNLSVSLVHSFLSSITSVTALVAVSTEFVGSDNWMRVRLRTVRR